MMMMKNEPYCYNNKQKTLVIDMAGPFYNTQEKTTSFYQNRESLDGKAYIFHYLWMK
jgi:hypothetical protein